MDTNKPAVSYSLDGQIELVIHARSNQIIRTVSFDNGETWLRWRHMPNYKTDRPVAFVVTPDSRTKYLVYRRERPADDPSVAVERITGKHFDNSATRYVFNVTGQYGFSWGTQAISGEAVFKSGPAVACAPAGSRVYLFGIGSDDRLYWSRSDNGGSKWAWWCAKLGEGVYTSEPAVAMSADGNTIMVFGIGTDDRCYYSRTRDAGKSWDIITAPITHGAFTSGPSVCMSADGKDLVVAGRGRDNRIYCIKSEDAGNSWRGDWAPIGGEQDGAHFSSGPGLCGSWDLSKVFVFGIKDHNRVWKAFRLDKNQPIGGWSPADRDGHLGAI